MIKLRKCEKERKPLMTQMRAWITDYYGKQCPEEEPGCPICDAWYAFNILFENESRQVDKH